MNKKLLKKLLLIRECFLWVINVTNCDDSNRLQENEIPQRLQQNETPRGYSKSCRRGKAVIL